MVFLLILALSIISGVGITIILVPIRRMVEAIRNIARGDLSTKVDIRSKDELGVLADSFNSMSEELQKTTVSRDYLDNILRSMTDAMIIFSPEGRIISVNKATRDILGYDKSEIIGKDVQSLFSKHTVSKLGLMGKGFAKFIRENPTGPYEVTFLTKNNDRVPVLFSASDVYGKNGKLEEIVGVGKDISKLRESQEELRRLNEQLKRNEQAVLNILSDLKKSHEELKASQEKLVQTEKLASLGRLVSDMAHEVNNPLQIISGRAQISLMEKIQNTEVEESLDIIMDQCERARDIIQRLLLFSKPSKGEIKEIGINDAIEFVAKLLEHQFLLAGVKIIRDYEGGLPPLKLDEKQIHEVFMNLMRNSADAMKGGGTITIRTTREGDKVRTDVTDTGGGIADEDLNKLFDPFFTTKEHGTGLGLSVCYGIIKAHGGELTYSSKLGTGTTATILLPVK
jgi:two-component system NtrC family sensor kinase